MPDALPVIQPTVSKHSRELNVLTSTTDYHPLALSRDVKALRPDWPWGQIFDLGLELLATASTHFGLGLKVLASSQNSTSSSISLLIVTGHADCRPSLNLMIARLSDDTALFVGLYIDSDNHF